MTQTLSVALWATHLAPPITSLADWLANVEARLAQAQAGGARLLIMPELTCVQWVGFAPPGLALHHQIPWLASIAAEALAALQPLVTRYGVALVPGTMPFALSPNEDRPRYSNRAWLLLPDGGACSQDKLFLTPSEQRPDGWLFTPGSEFNTIIWEGLRIGIVICVDIESTALWARLARLDLDLILVPAKTEKFSGYHRVFGCAKARAIELQTVVCVVGAVGTPLTHPGLDLVVGGAAAFVPCEPALGSTGVAAVLEPRVPLSAEDNMLFGMDLPVGYCREIRHGAAEAEVWPGLWDVDRVAFT